jgi:nitric oxide reductase activation protein
VRYLYGAKNRDRYSLGQYGDGNNNYDHQAILTAAKLFEENTRQTNRCMIVLSDGAPNGFLYEGQDAIRGTRDVVKEVRRRGIKVLNVAIADHKSEAIFGKEHVLKFTDLRELVLNMRRLILRLVCTVS